MDEKYEKVEVEASDSEDDDDNSGPRSHILENHLIIIPSCFC